MRARLFLFLAFCLALPGLRAAAADGLEIETIVTATERYLINHQWNLMVVSVRNRSAKEQTAGLRLRFGNQANLFLRTQTFAPRSTSKVYIPVYANFTEEEVEKAIKTRDNKISFSDGTSYTIVRRHGTLKCTAALVNLDNGQEYSVHDDSLFAMRGDTIFAADLFGDDQLPALPISGQYADGLPFVLGDRQEHNLRYTISQIAAATSIAERNLPEESSDISLRSCLIAPENLPAEPLFWRGLQVCYSGILKRSDGSSGLNPMQKNELLQWLAAGGQLIVMPTYDLQSYIEDPFWAALLPVTLTGTRTFSAADGAALARLIAAKKPEKELLGQIITSAVPANDCEILAAADGEVLLARRPYGAGMIYFCAFTGGALQPWSQNQKIFTLLSQIPHPPAGEFFRICGPMPRK